MIISLKEARKILGKEASDKLSDEELERVIDDLDYLARAALKMAKEDLLEAKKEEIKNRNAGGKKKS